MLLPFIRGFKTWGKAPPLFLALCLFFLILGINLLLGSSEISFSIFYLLPIILATRFLGRSAGVVFSLASTSAWLLADLAVGVEFGDPLAGAWNTLVRLGFFLVVTFAVAARHTARITLQQVRERERDLSRRDVLTGLINGHGFVEQALELARGAGRACQTLTVVFLDLDNLRSLNERFGRRAGDTALAEVARGIKALLRPQDLCGRVGGDEFAILLPGIDACAAERLGTALQNMFRELQARSGRPVQASIGMAVSLSGGNDIQILLQWAEQLMYTGKEAGKGQVRLEVLDLNGNLEPSLWAAAAVASVR